MDSSASIETQSSQKKVESDDLVEKFKPRPCVKEAAPIAHVTESKRSPDVSWWVADPDRRLARTVLLVSATVEEEIGRCPPISWIPKSTDMESDLENKRSWTTAEMRSDLMGYFESKYGSPTINVAQIKPGDYKLSHGANFAEMTEEEKEEKLEYLQLVAESYPTLYTKQKTEIKFVKGEPLEGKCWYYKHDLIEGDGEPIPNDSTSADCIPLVQFEK